MNINKQLSMFALLSNKISLIGEELKLDYFLFNYTCTSSIASFFFEKVISKDSKIAFSLQYTLRATVVQHCIIPSS